MIKILICKLTRFIVFPILLLVGLQYFIMILGFSFFIFFFFLIFVCKSLMKLILYIVKMHILSKCKKLYKVK